MIWSWRAYFMSIRRNMEKQPWLLKWEISDNTTYRRFHQEQSSPRYIDAHWLVPKDLFLQVK
jgi:hypothetical protein